MIRGPYRKRPNLRIAVASVIGICCSPLLVISAKAGSPIDPQGEANDGNVSPLSAASTRGSSTDETMPIHSTSPFHQDGAAVKTTKAGKPAKNATAGFRVSAVERDDKSNAKAPAAFRVHAITRDSAAPAEAPGDSVSSSSAVATAAPAAGFRTSAPSRDDADLPASERKGDLCSRNELFEQAPPIASGPSNTSNLSDGPNPGFYPTTREWDTIGGYYTRLHGDNPGGTESGTDTQAPSGLWPYPSASDPLFGAHPAFFNAVDRYLGLFTNSGVLASQGSNPSTGALYSFDGGIPFVTRAFNPQRSTFKLGPVYIDLLQANADVLYSQYRGPETFPKGEGPGWLEFVSLDFRVLVPLAENLFLGASGEVYYLPRKGQFGIFMGDTNGAGVGLHAFLAWEKEYKGWWITVTDHLGTEDRFADFFQQASVNEIDSAGRYRFGTTDTRGQSGIDYFSPKRAYVFNTFDVSAIGLLSPTWRMTNDLIRSDGTNFNGDHLGNDYHGTTSLNTRIEYYGTDWRFSPYFLYNVSTPDDFQSFLHQLEVGAQGPITERLRIDGFIGYGFTTGFHGDNQSFLWQIGLVHEFGPYTQQSLYLGNVMTFDQYGDRFSGRYIRYTLDQVISKHINASFYVQWQDTRDIDTDYRTQGPSGGAFLNFELGYYTELRAGIGWEDFKADGTPSSQHIIFTAQLRHQIRAGLTGSLIYQKERYQEDDGGLANFSENLYELELTLAF